MADPKDSRPQQPTEEGIRSIINGSYNSYDASISPEQRALATGMVEDFDMIDLTTPPSSPPPTYAPRPAENPFVPRAYMSPSGHLHVMPYSVGYQTPILLTPQYNLVEAQRIQDTENLLAECKEILTKVKVAIDESKSNLAGAEKDTLKTSQVFADMST
jgi:hypothetical protein